MSVLNQKVAIITGGARGIGYSTAEQFLQAGAQVLITDIEGVACEAAAKQLSSAGGKVIAAVHDVANETRWQEIYALATAGFGGVDILVNNAGVGQATSLVDTTLAEWRRIMSINCDAVFLGMKHAIPAMCKRGGGSIINVASIMGKVGFANSAAYCASKGAVTLMTKAAALECAAGNMNIRVNSVHPGFVQTPMLSEGMDARPDGAALLAMLDQLHPIGRLGRSPEIAAAILFLASDAASFMTGSEMLVDGGYTAQ